MKKYFVPSGFQRIVTLDEVYELYTIVTKLFFCSANFGLFCEEFKKTYRARIV